MARKNIGAKPYITPMPVLMLSSYDDDGKVSFEKFRPLAYDWMNKACFSIGPKVGTAYRDGLALK